MALIPLKAIPLLDGKLVAHIYSDTPLWLSKLSDQLRATFPSAPKQGEGEAEAEGVEGDSFVGRIERLVALAVQEWSGELAAEMSPWSRPTRATDLSGMDIEHKVDLLSELTFQQQLGLLLEYNKASSITEEKKSTSNAESESMRQEDSPSPH